MSTDKQTTPELVSSIPASLRVATVIVDELIRSGVKEAVVCPGSRSAPLALAFGEAARTSRIRMHIRSDERTASFLALSLADFSMTPVPIVVTSGTAVANCFPAMVEASLRQVPLVMLSANRPWVEQNTGSSQTIDQFHIFGRHAKFFAGLDAAVVQNQWTSQPDFLLKRVRSTVDRALAAALSGGDGGAVHLDIPFVEPLVPSTSTTVSMVAQEVAQARTDAERGSAGVYSEGEAGPWTLRSPRTTFIGDMKYNFELPFGQIDVDLSKRTLVIAGDVHNKLWASEMLELLADVPTIAEPSSPAPATPVHPGAAGLFRQSAIGEGEQTLEVHPEQIVVIGHPTLHRDVMALLADPTIPKLELSDSSVVTDAAAEVRLVGSTVNVVGDNPKGWVRTTEAMSQIAAQNVKDILADPTTGFTGLHATAVVADSLRDGETVVSGASNPIRDLSTVGLPFAGVKTYSSRGAAGIDGMVSTIIGTALASESGTRESSPALRAPRTVGLLGDLTFLHDVSGLNIGPDQPRPQNLVIVVSNDAGGSIFETLEAGAPDLRQFTDGSDLFEEVFATPNSSSLKDLCTGFHIAYAHAGTALELETVLENHVQGGIDQVAQNSDYYPGILLVEATVTREQRRAIHQALSSGTSGSKDGSEGGHA